MPALPQVVLDRLNGLYADALSAIPDGTSKDDGIAAGAAAAAAMLAERTGDGRYVPLALPAGDEAGEWRPTLPAFVSDPNAWVSKVTPFTLKSTSQFRTKGPLDLESKAYAKEYDEVKLLGSSTSVRTPEQQAIAAFFQPNPVEMLQRALRDVTEDEGMGVVDEARFYAQLNAAAGATPAINCWDEKVFWALLASDHGDPGRRQRRQSAHDGGSRVAAAHRVPRRTRITRPATTATPAR